MRAACPAATRSSSGSPPVRCERQPAETECKLRHAGSSAGPWPEHYAAHVALKIENMTSLNHDPTLLPLSTVEGLNKACYCRTLNPDRLRENLESDASLAGLAQRIVGAEVKPWLLNPAVAIGNAGAVTEAFVGQELLAYSRPWAEQELHYWHREARASNAEVDYLLPLGDVVVPVEVKSGATGRLRSLRAFLDEKRSTTPYGLRFCGQPASIHQDLHSYAIYAVPHVLREQIQRDWF